MIQQLDKSIGLIAYVPYRECGIFYYNLFHFICYQSLSGTYLDHEHKENNSID